MGSETVIGEHIVIVGSHVNLGLWDPLTSPVLLTTDATQYPIWKGSCELPSGYNLEYKFVIRNGAEEFRWENTANRRITVPDVGVTLNAKFDTLEEAVAGRVGQRMALRAM